MSKRHADQIMAASDVLRTEEGRSCAFAYLLGVLSAKAEYGKPVSATRLAKAVADAVEYAKTWPGERAEAEKQWRVAAETELPEPRKVPDLDPTHFSHAMTGIGKETSWCGAPGPVAVFAFSVTCPVCRTMLSREEEGDLGARTLAVSPLDDGGALNDAGRDYAEEAAQRAAAEHEGQEENAAAVDEERYREENADRFYDAEHYDVDDEDKDDDAGELHPHFAALDAEFAAEQAKNVTEGWTPKASAPLPDSRKIWVHMGPCIYCAHGPGCVTCDLTDGPNWGTGSPGHEYPGPVCDICSEECKRREIAADPYYSGDYVAMFGDDE